MDAARSRTAGPSHPPSWPPQPAPGSSLAKVALAKIANSLREGGMSFPHKLAMLGKLETTREALFRRAWARRSLKCRATGDNNSHCQRASRKLFGWRGAGPA